MPRSRSVVRHTTRLAAFTVLTAGSLTCIPLSFAADAPAKAAAKPADPHKTAVWTDAADPTLPIDFKIQGEYQGEIFGEKVGAQVIALGNGAFQAVLLQGGLPGDGAKGEKMLLAGKLDGEKVAFSGADGKRKYLSQSPDEFSATTTVASDAKGLTGSIAVGSDSLVLKPVDGATSTFKKVNRTSPTLGAKPPEGAIVLFDGSNKDKWKGGRLDEKTRVLNTDGNDITTVDKFKNYTMHVEFMLAYRPEGRGQGRGNSGFYQVDLYEVQILDSFGLDGKNNECGGVYTKAEPKVNMCYPPLVWQTYDADFTSAEVDASGKKVKNARLTLKHNGVTVHDNIEIDGKTGGSRNEPEGTSGPIKLQGHGNPTQFRNIWIVPK